MAHAHRGEQLSGEVSVNGQGRVTIPAEIRHATGIEPGMTVHVHVQGGAVVLESRDEYVARIRREISERWTGGAGSVVDELIADRRSEAAREEEDVA